MLNRDEILAALKQARRMDLRRELFGADKHKYQLNLPIRASFVRALEEKYHFSLPDDYFHFITEIGDGGAGPDYGIEPFAKLAEKGQDPYAAEYMAAYRNSLKMPFAPRPMRADELETFAIGTKEDFAQHPDRYFVYQKSDEESCHLDGFYVLGTQGCQWDFGLVTAGEMRGSVFVTDNTGAYHLAADSFEAFYQNWLDWISDEEKLKAELEKRRKLFKIRRF